MNLLTLAIPTIMILVLAVPLIKISKKDIGTPEVRRKVITNLVAFMLIGIVIVATPLGSMIAYGASTEVCALPAVNPVVGTWAQAFGFISAAMVTSVTAIGAAMAISAAAPAAIGAVSEDPKSFGKAIIFVVLGEGIAIYGLLISILIINKL